MKPVLFLLAMIAYFAGEKGRAGAGASIWGHLGRAKIRYKTVGETFHGRQSVT